ncbi:MAG TPA: HAD family phosphatase [Planctomycetaceae bacterium]|nr:HAD family phosphatase [Planctomycetaceae bacterium]HQZ67481.1 HAD family phosphatase [Planctomycetaceae bacterium]
MPNLPEIRAVVFDLDGLMLNTEDVFDLAGKQLLERRGLEMTDDIRHRMLGRRPVDAFNALKSLTGMTDRIEDLMHETKELFEAIAENTLTTMPGLHDVLELIESRDLPRAVATSSPRSYMTQLLERFGLLHRFHFTLTAEDVTHGKPHPEIYLMAASMLNVPPSQMLVLEDSETGTRAAATAGAYIVSVPNRHTAVGDFSMSRLRIDSLLDKRLHDLLR